MNKKAPTKRIDRRDVPILLAEKYLKDYEASITEFPEDKRVEFLDHLIECLGIIKNYAEKPTEENYKVYADKENAFLKKHGKRLKMYRQTRMYLYYGDHHVLIEKGIYSADEWNALSTAKQRLSTDEFIDFILFCRARIYLDRDFLWASQAPEDEREGNSHKEVKESLNGIANQRKRKITRDAHDKLTSLNQEQTALLVHYLQQEKVFLKGEHLNDKEMGTAFEILTGYSQHTLRQTLGKFTKSISKENLKEIDNLLTRLKIAIGKDLKEK